MSAGDTSTTSASSDDGKRQSLAEFLEEVSVRIIGHISARNWTHPDWTDYIADKFREEGPVTSIDRMGDGPVTSREAYIERFKTFTAANPEYDLEPTRVDVDLDMDDGLATVWLVLSVTGYPPNVRKENVSVVQWQRIDGRWLAMRMIGFRGAHVD